EFGCLKQHAREVERLVPGARSRRRRGARHLQPGIPGELLDGVRKGLAAELHQEADGRAVGATAEAMVELLGRADREGGCLLAVERAAGSEVSARFFERDV